MNELELPVINIRLYAYLRVIFDSHLEATNIGVDLIRVAV